MKYVGMQEVVFDQQNIAFPGLGNCHGIVYVNANGLFAYHLSGDPRPVRTAAFGQFVANHVNGGGPGLGLIGFCPTNRFGSDAGQRGELQPFAAALNYNGPIRGFRWNIAALGWGNMGTTYVDVYFNQGAIVCSYERFEDVKEPLAPNPEPANHQSVLLGPMAVAAPIALAQVTPFALRTGVPSFVNPRTL
ncbi:hypothetical protein [Roseomonas sp. AR75]|uniref:hypothetical protein n=1 Tax=Roseomonas sp. AR75 TaxID=2562311 RepID=UPI0010C017E3|nr:hypothetical protein [Roseomonas sp. AR75]